MKTDIESFLVAKILAQKQKISGLTRDFIRLVKDKLEYDEKVNAFYIRNSEWNIYSNTQKLLWMIVLFIAIPVLVIFDYASLKPFVEYLQHMIGYEGIGRFFKIIGFSIFFILELAVCLAIIRINEYIEKEPNTQWRIAKPLLAIAMIIVPSILILAGYLLQASPSTGDGMKVSALILVSLVVHCALFLLIDYLLKAISYIIFLIQKWMLKRQDPTKHLEKRGKQLLSLYPQYDVDVTTLSGLPSAVMYIPTIKLGRREEIVRERLEEGIDEEDYDELINLKSHSPKPPFSGSGSTGSASSSSSTVW